jgi:phospholipase/carboxylesterase
MSQGSGRLTARPRPPRTPLRPTAGLHRILIGDREAEFFAPELGPAEDAVPLLVMLHGAGGRPDQIMSLAQPFGQDLGFAVLAPKSKGATWDVIEGGFGPDVGFIDAALARVFDGFPVDPKRVGIGGFSDGASYALSLGLLNGDLFSEVLAFSPGFAVSPEVRGHPRIFISHGEDDAVLPIARCGRRLARDLRRAGYDMLYREFAGGHVIPPDLAELAMGRFLGRDGTGPEG